MWRFILVFLPLSLIHADSMVTEFKDSSGSGYKYHSFIQRAARQYSLDPKLVHAVIQVESAYNPYAVSRKGAQGLMQDANGKWVMTIDADNYDGVGALLPGGDYTMPLPAGYVEDWAGQTNLATNINFTVPDPGAAPTVVNGAGTNQDGTNPNRVLVTYTRNVGLSALNVSNYAIDGMRIRSHVSIMYIVPTE